MRYDFEIWILLLTFVGVSRTFCGGSTGFWWYQVVLLSVGKILAFTFCYLVISVLDVLLVSGWSLFLLSVCKPVSTLPGGKISPGKSSAQRAAEQPHLQGADVVHRTLSQRLCCFYSLWPPEHTHPKESLEKINWCWTFLLSHLVFLSWEFFV